jgi:hypothetical protein
MHETEKGIKNKKSADSLVAQKSSLAHTAKLRRVQGGLGGYSLS